MYQGKLNQLGDRIFSIRMYTGLFHKEDHLTMFGQKISIMFCLIFEFICLYYIESEYKNTKLNKCKLNLCNSGYFIPKL